MDFEKILGTIKDKFNLSDEQCQKATEIFTKYFASGQDGKNNIIKLLKEKLNIGEDKANDIYNEVTKFLEDNVVNKIKGLFGKQALKSRLRAFRAGRRIKIPPGLVIGGIFIEESRTFFNLSSFYAKRDISVNA